MGIVIHYQGKIDDINEVDELAGEIADFGQELGWNSQLWTKDWSKPNTTKVTFENGVINVTGHAPLRGVTLKPHEDSEPFSLTFSPEGYLVSLMGMALIADDEITPQEAWMSTKTNFAPIEIHITIVKLLRYLKRRYISNLEVRDEGAYWETEDLDELQRRRDRINRSLDILEDALDEIPAKNIRSKSPQEIADMIEKMIEEKFGN